MSSSDVYARRGTRKLVPITSPMGSQTLLSGAAAAGTPLQALYLDPSIPSTSRLRIPPRGSSKLKILARYSSSPVT
ncbi:uncharacterized protein BO72DRAFT_446603 [Aspergillus fijiensis CBS 313.89]|uniref:Uncharacterized protein n=1 Tax=Aspergillus fijiensis CBS 313.89 TaxID=1448319 RepID=A0A8G1RT61_9EURO|nr:uncharacterized protein BO72DRAFT_446603 [Aspergillus fijiensis CBS 313.89]RAK78819.1 hypothetical protein BO72DRAFT_446603 [Aspergillus fijiensis CBS 313.89]